MEANQFSWHSTLHTSQDHNGIAGGYGGGDGYNGPRDWTSSRYAPHSPCIDTSKPVNIAASFPVNEQGKLLAMEVTISQEGHDCSVMTRISDYTGMPELSAALAAGMTPVVSYWSSDKMLWMDGQGADGKGPCKRDNAAACPASVRFSRFAVTPIREAGLPRHPSAPVPSVQPLPPVQPVQPVQPVLPSTTTPKLYLAGQGEEVKAGSGESHGAFDLLNEAADLVLAAANHALTAKEPSTGSTFDCNAGFAEWQLGWSRMKKAHCCHEVDIPCPQTDALPVPQSSNMPATRQTTTPLIVIPDVSQEQHTCTAAYQQCGGRNWLGATCCYDGCTCKGYSEYYKQCVPNVAGGTCAAPVASTAIFLRKDGIRNSKTLASDVEVRTKVLRGLLSVSMCAMAFLMSALAVFTVHRRLTAQVRPDRLGTAGTASAGDSDPETPAPPLFFRSTLREPDSNREPLEFFDIDLPRCQERLFQRQPSPPMEEEVHRCYSTSTAFVSRGVSPKQIDEASRCSSQPVSTGGPETCNMCCPGVWEEENGCQCSHGLTSDGIFVIRQI